MAPNIFHNAVSALLIISPFTLSNAHTHHLHRRAVAVSTKLPTPWTSKGCYTEGTNGRALAGANYADGMMTEENCITFCDNKGYIYAGVEYSSECFCGNTLGTGAVLATAQTDCDMACSGDATEACGGGNRLNLFTSGKTPPAGPDHNPGPDGWALQGCYVDGGARTLTTPVATTGGGAALTVALCASACKSGSYLYAGVEYGGECYCGNAYSNGGAPAPEGLSGCNVLCNGNSSEYCGGPNRLDVYKFGGTIVKPTSTKAATPSSAATNLPAGWTYKGCYVDNLNGRILINQQPDDQMLTNEVCVQACVKAGYKVSGMEYGVQCFCGNSISNGGALADSDTECGISCAGNAKEKCGDGNRMSIFSTGAITTTQKPGAQKTGLPGSWKYQGCITEGKNARVFKYQSIFKDTNSAETCLNLCAKYRYEAAGMEYGEECFCGDSTDLADAGSITAPEADCGVPCPGNSSYLCGGGDRLSYYTWVGTPLTKWKTGVGNGAGAYNHLIGGVVIPLLTTLGVNGKVAFVEKYGTGEPNSTGAYELDLSQVDNFKAAWREMHVKTDVFCSAGVTLPDKAGRQINIGGWSGDSTYGIRIYWPDGSPGVPGKNDWQENVAELKLQVGRWYPSALVMTNGSILVVGGEEGSNGKPVPSLEILPKPPGGGLVTLDFLKTTDPFNLYPFLAVLPSGKIFIACYNEARILDPVTWATTKQLPGIPGSVNTPLGGRTYPLEGTAMLLPQYAPFTAPLGIIICGGSTPGAAVAIDNCVSTTPEVTGAQWLLERMPSQRVISCMTALPDGTYMIMNGAKQGAAGFGLASNPNLVAVMYDPTLPAHNRFTIMASTTIARLYHSEAILIPDGRVMVSGSDPQDGVHPEEYRVETFTPPYLLNGKARPKFTMTNKSWGYGATITLTGVNFPGGNIPRVSMLGADTSTHGNSMGQRTLFPAIKCNGGTCQITAPPNGRVCPPGWYQIFLLDGPTQSGATPSLGQFIHFGGDPAKMGNWPNYPDFKVPGI